MSSTWTIEGDTNEGTFAALGLANLTRTLVSQSPDKITFDAPGAAYDGNPLFAYEEQITIKKDDNTWFTGVIITNPRLGDPADERITYVAAGPWWHLEQCTYQQNWQLYNTGDSQLEAQAKSRVILCQDADGNRIDSGEQIADALDYAISRGAPITKGTIDPDVQIPWDECVDITCSEVIQKMLRWSPECVCWFDYSTENPTFNCRKRAKLTAVSVAVGQGDPHERINITPRYDLQIPGIILRYEQTHQVDGTSYETTTLDQAGDTGDLRTLISTIELAGKRVRNLTQKIVTEDWPVDLNDSDWWKARLPWLDEATVQNLTIHDAARSQGNYDRILVEGQIHDWMNVNSEDDKTVAQADYLEKDADDDEVNDVKNRKITTTPIATDATTRTYRRLGDYESGEAIPTGVAAALYASWNELQYDGQLTLVEDEVSGVLYLGAKLNLTGGRSEWQTMNALVQQVTENVDQGHTTVTFGPASHLSPDDLISVLNHFRKRRASYHYVARSTGESDDAGGSVSLSGPAPKDRTSSLDAPHRRIRLKTKRGASDEFDNVIDINSKAINTQANVTAEPQQITVLTDFRYDTSSHKLQKKTITGWFICSGSETGWTDVTGGQASGCNE